MYRVFLSCLSLILFAFEVLAYSAPKIKIFSDLVSKFTDGRAGVFMPKQILLFANNYPELFVGFSSCLLLIGIFCFLNCIFIFLKISN